MGIRYVADHIRFNDGIIYFVIIVTSLIMMLGLMFTKTNITDPGNVVVGEDKLVE